MLSAIVQKATGQTVRDFLEPRLFAPLGIKLRVNGRDQSVVCGLDRWHPGRLAWETLPERPVAASGAWTASDRYEARICFRETPYTLKLPLRFEGTRVTVEPEYNVFFGPGKLPAVTGDAD
jgi:CubicO group peptidase (beta-lactamase class C family)